MSQLKTIAQRSLLVLEIVTVQVGLGALRGLRSALVFREWLRQREPWLPEPLEPEPQLEPYTPALPNPLDLLHLLDITDVIDVSPLSHLQGLVDMMEIRINSQPPQI